MSLSLSTLSIQFIKPSPTKTTSLISLGRSLHRDHRGARLSLFGLPPISKFQPEFKRRLGSFYVPISRNWNFIRTNSRNERWHRLQSHRSISSTNSRNSSPGSDPSLAWKQGKKQFNQGPDQILPSTADYTWEQEGAVKIKETAGKNILEIIPPMSIPSLFKNTVERLPNSVALGLKVNNVWETWTYEQYYRDVLSTAKGFIALGLQKHHAVCILSMNSPEWFLSNFGAIFAGGISTGIYATNLPDAVAYCATDSRCNLFVVQDDIQFTKVEKIHSQLKHLKAVIQVEGEPRVRAFKGDNSNIKILTWSELMAIGKGASDQTVEECLRSVALNQCATLIYTSGTTGVPKGVMLSHDNFTYAARAFVESGKELISVNGDEKLVSFLPLSHSAAEACDIYISLVLAAGVYFADKDVLRGSLINTLKEVEPTIFLSVPRFYEKVHEQLLEIRRLSGGGPRRILIDFAKAKAYQHTLLLFQGNKDPDIPGFKLLDKLLFSKIRAQMGFAKCRNFFAGAAPLSPEILRYFMSLSIPICEVFGLTETSGPHTGHTLCKCRLGSVGTALPGAKSKILEADGDGQGELILTGRHIMMGYLGHPEKTTKAFTSDGYLRTGDVGFIDPDGFIFITGREKDIIITAGGENVAPTAIEDRVKKHLHIVSHAVIIGEKQKCLTLLITLKTENDPITAEPTDKLTPFVQAWISEFGEMEVQSLSEIQKETEVGSSHKLREAIQTQIDLVNEEATSNAQLIRNWLILKKDFSMAGGELGPTMKLKRRFVAHKYADTIQRLYQLAPK